MDESMKTLKKDDPTVVYIDKIDLTKKQISLSATLVKENTITPDQTVVNNDHINDSKTLIEVEKKVDEVIEAAITAATIEENTTDIFIEPQEVVAKLKVDEVVEKPVPNKEENRLARINKQLSEV